MAKIITDANRKSQEKTIKTYSIEKEKAAERRAAMETQQCPRCGDRIFPRRVLDEHGCTSNDFIELFCIKGHVFTIHMADIPKPQEEK